MTLRRTFWTCLIVLLVLVLIDELAYFVWRRRNRGEHWSHLQGRKTGLQNWDETEMGTGILNRSWSGRF